MFALSAWRPYLTGSATFKLALGRLEAVTLDIMEIMTAVPIDETTWRMVLLTEVPSPSNRSGNALIPVVVTGMLTMVTPNIRMAYMMVMNKIGVLSVTVRKNIEPMRSKNIPVIANRLPPSWSKMRPVKGLMIPIITAPGSKIRPDWKAESPWTVWIYRGRIISKPIMDMLTMATKIADNVKAGDLKTLSCKMGLLILNWRTAKKMAMIRPAMSGP